MTIMKQMPVIKKSFVHCSRRFPLPAGALDVMTSWSNQGKVALLHVLHPLDVPHVFL